jgi:diguanylate cyclase (GGDEF)-like protein
MEFLRRLEGKNKIGLTVIAFGLIGIIGVLDFLTGYELAFSLFYLFPILLLTWLTTLRLGIISSIFSALVWLVADVAAGNIYSSPLIYLWNTLVRLSFFIISTLLLSSLRYSFDHERELARTDYLTGAVNSRNFYEIIQTEIDRFQRYRRPFTLVYIDLDDFKRVNDALGHSTGDQALRTVAGTIKKNLRKSDVIARLGGDEFALLLLEMDQETAGVVLPKLQSILLEEMRQRNLPVTFSIGVLTCLNLNHTVDELLKMADDLMYQVKHDGKNSIKYSNCLD